MKRPFLTVLTAPIHGAPRRLYQGVRSAIRPLVKPGVPLPAVSPYPGHRALVRSVVEGLRSIDADFNFNPRRFRDLGAVVYAPANEALRQAVGLKGSGRIDYLVAGPVNVLFPSQCDGLLRKPEIDRVIVASDWVRQFYREDAPELLPKIRLCACGVDAEYWKPSSAPEAGRILVYWKSGTEIFCEAVERTVAKLGRQPVRVRYGEYDPESYRRILDGVELGVFLSSFETQGLALAEAWSMDVPTAVWDPRAAAEWMGRSFEAGSSCPFLTPSTGRTWRTIDELGTVLAGALEKRNEFRPRDWVLTHMTDAICSAALYEIIRDGRRGAAASA
jgi:glycosyltransferase involved in cell wall biosynthesis